MKFKGGGFTNEVFYFKIEELTLSKKSTTKLLMLAAVLYESHKC